MSEPKKTKYAPIRAAIVEGFEDLRTFIQKELDEIGTVFDNKANRIDDPDNLTVDSSNVLPVTDAEILELLGDTELPPQYLIHVTFDFDPAGAGMYYFSPQHGAYQYINQFPDNGAFALPIATQESDVPILPYPGQMVMVDGGWLGGLASNDGVYVWHDSKVGGAGWMKLDWSVPVLAPLTWVEITGFDRNFNIDPVGGGYNGGPATQPSSPPAYHITEAGGLDWVGTVGGFSVTGHQFAVVNDSSNRDCTVEFPGQPDETVQRGGGTGHWVYNGSTFDRQ